MSVILGELEAVVITLSERQKKLTHIVSNFTQ